MIFWKIIIDACLDAGFSLTKVEWQEQAVSSGTQGINRKNTLKGDFIYTFLKDENNNKTYKDKCGVEEILKEAKKIFKKQSFVHASHIYEVLIPFIVNNRYFIDENNELIDLEKIISRNYKYGPMIVNDGIAYGWYK